MSNRGLPGERDTNEIGVITKLYLIAGIDPGTTEGIAALDFNGNTVDVLSSKDLGLDKTIRHLMSLGTVSMIATDVNPTPGFVSKLAAQLGSVVFTPQESLTVSEKIVMTRGYEISDSHQRDALAAALTAFNKFRNKFQKIDSLKLAGGDNVKHLVLHGLSISRAQKKLMSEKVKKVESIIEEEKPVKRSVSDERMMIRRLEKQSRVLKEHIHAKEEEINELKGVISKIKRRYDVELRERSEVKKRNRNIRNLRYRLCDVEKKLKRIEGLKELWQKAAEGEIRPVGVFPKQTRGLIWIKSRLKKRDLDRLGEVEVAFTDDAINRRYMMNKGFTTADTKYLSEFEGCSYVYARDITRIRYMEAKEGDISLEGVIEEYRTDRG
ncbi:MAG: DUF460 domain-containing protein [Candidatus Altiarchaeota archaeon]|nr:DUF460 domain-containing protein [Candidatus Altiarchaeota archaeon]